MSLRLFYSPYDEIEDRRRACSQRAQHQCRCGCCGRFAIQTGLRYGAVCDHCVRDTRSAIRRKVEQAEKWWQLVAAHPL
jgi:hypothetical protein